MTLVLRPLTAPSLVDLGIVGVVRAALVVQEVGAWGTGPLRVEYLRPIRHEDKGDETGLHQRADHAGQPVGERGAGG